jgi:hypothetical protein
MDDRAEIRDFLMSRRAKLTPEEAGLPGGMNRRVAGLRRAEVAVLAGVSVEYYSRPDHRGRTAARCRTAAIQTEAPACVSRIPAGWQASLWECSVVPWVGYSGES